jgi:hypothetical protein
MSLNLTNPRCGMVCSPLNKAHWCSERKSNHQCRRAFPGLPSNVAKSAESVEVTDDIALMIKSFWDALGRFLGCFFGSYDGSVDPGFSHWLADVLNRTADIVRQ